MTRQDFSPPPGFFMQEIWKWLARLGLWAVSFVLLAIFTPYWDQAISVWRAPQTLQEMQASLDGLRSDLRAATGEDRVIRQPPGLSYVQEPVIQGDNVIAFLKVQRTKMGKDCRLLDWTPLFSDASNVVIPGRRAAENVSSRRATTETGTFRVEMIPPAILLPGRIEVYLALDYDCGGQRVSERTDTITYRLIERSTP